MALIEFDPDKSLVEIRRGIKVLGEHGGHNRGTYLRALAYQVEMLDEWLSKGGYPPAAWQPLSKTPEAP